MKNVIGLTEINRKTPQNIARGGDFPHKPIHGPVIARVPAKLALLRKRRAGTQRKESPRSSVNIVRLRRQLLLGPGSARRCAALVRDKRIYDALRNSSAMWGCADSSAVPVTWILAFTQSTTPLAIRFSIASRSRK